ncbi:MAG: DHA2 family efflux MFS transporter permease subunit, partial [Deltaproteobacteria bacterium]
MNKWLITLSVLLPTLLEVIDTSVVNVSLNHIRGSLSAGIDEATWTITAYLVSNAIIIPLSGWLSRVFGRRRYLLFSVILFTFSSFMCGSSKTLAMLVFFRILQGIGGGGMQPLSQAILLETFPPHQYGMAMAMFGIGIMVGPIVGPVLGGWITDNWSWPWIFYINIPLGILSLIMISTFIFDPPYLKHGREKEEIDYWGIGLITVGLGCLQVVLDKGQREDWFQSSFIVWLSVIAAISLIAFVFVELRAKHPVVDMKVFKDKSFSSANVIQATAFFVMFSSIILLPLFVQELMGYTAYLAGLVMGPGGIATLCTLPVVGQLISRKFNPKIILAFGLCMVAFSSYVASQLNLSVDFYQVVMPRVFLGLGMGMVFVPLASMAFSTIPKHEMGNATSVFNLNRNISGSFGVAFMTTLLAQRAQFHQARLTEQLNPYDMRYQIAVRKLGNPGIYGQLMRQSNLNAFMDCFYISAIIMLCVIPLILLLRRPAHMKGKEASEILH